MVLTNHQLAERLRERAHRLAQEGANVYRVRALRRAAMVILGLPYEAAQMATPQGRKMLTRLPGIGRGIARTISEWVRLSQMETEVASGAVDHDGVIHLSSARQSDASSLSSRQQRESDSSEREGGDHDLSVMIPNRKG
jgi:DNA polymerase/3'-5' exonuclease PolX